MIACRREHTATARLLVAKGADIEARNTHVGVLLYGLTADDFMVLSLVGTYRYVARLGGRVGTTSS
jgi:ankyrin repeat protein